MGVPAAVAGDTITGTCLTHLIPSPTGAIKAPPLPFAAKLTTGLATNVFISGKPVALVGSSGVNVPHPPLADAFAAPPTQMGRVVSGSTSVFVGQQAVATQSSRCTMCAEPATALVATAATVLVG
jgi:uncharacterized Zn-binding protein involved in type VI secretion